MLEYIYICRHGFRTNWSNQGNVLGPTGVIRDYPLTAYGEHQSADLALFLTSQARVEPHLPPERVVSSPYIRCVRTAAPTAEALGVPIAIEHGIQEYYPPARAGSGLHPRPALRDKSGLQTELDRLYPAASLPPRLQPPEGPGLLDNAYESTLYPSRRGELIREIHDRADLFVEAFTARMEAEGVRSVALFSHAATVIALGRALTGDKDLDVCAGCATTSLYRRKARNPADPSSAPCGVGEWEVVWNGRADYMQNGVERDWNFSNAPIAFGEVIEDEGDFESHSPEDELPVGLGKGMERYLRRGRPKLNRVIKETLEVPLSRL